MIRPRLTPRLLRLLLNLYPPYLGAGIRVVRIGADWRELVVEMKLRWYNRNAVGTQFGGSLYAMVDPHLMLLLMQLLGRDYVVWDQAAAITFRRPGTGTVTARMALDDAVLETIRRETDGGQAYRPDFEVTIVGADGETVATVTKTLYVRRRPARSEVQRG